MSYNSIRTIVSTVAGVILIAAYIIYALGTNSPAPENLKSWATVMLVFIGIGAAALIIIQVLFHALAIGIAVRGGNTTARPLNHLILNGRGRKRQDNQFEILSCRVHLRRDWFHCRTCGISLWNGKRGRVARSVRRVRRRFNHGGNRKRLLL